MKRSIYYWLFWVIPPFPAVTSQSTWNVSLRIFISFCTLWMAPDVPHHLLDVDVKPRGGLPTDRQYGVVFCGHVSVYI